MVRARDLTFEAASDREQSAITLGHDRWRAPLMAQGLLSGDGDGAPLAQNTIVSVFVPVRSIPSARPSRRTAMLVTDDISSGPQTLAWSGTDHEGDAGRHLRVAGDPELQLRGGGARPVERGPCPLARRGRGGQAR